MSAREQLVAAKQERNGKGGGSGVCCGGEEIGLRIQALIKTSYAATHQWLLCSALFPEGALRAGAGMNENVF